MKIRILLNTVNSRESTDSHFIDSLLEHILIICFYFIISKHKTIIVGLRKIYQITSQGHYELWINLQDWEGGKTYASYKVFKLGNSKSQYELIVDDYYGDAGN